MSQIISNSLLTIDGQTIHYDLYQHGHKQLIIIAHGFFNSKDALLLKELGHALSNQYDILIMDFRGHGKSSGLFYWTSKEYLDLQAVLEHVKSSYTEIGVIGFSLGAATSIIAASNVEGIATVISISAPSEFEKIEYRFWELDIENDIFSLLS